MVSIFKECLWHILISIWLKHNNITNPGSRSIVPPGATRFLLDCAFIAIKFESAPLESNPTASNFFIFSSTTLSIPIEKVMPDVLITD